jgi:hypothetical protein
MAIYTHYNRATAGMTKRRAQTTLDGRRKKKERRTNIFIELTSTVCLVDAIDGEDEKIEEKKKEKKKREEKRKT